MYITGGDIADRNFFDEALDQSKVKAAIVSKYFWSWAKIIIGVSKRKGDDRIAYIDLFAGPGRYKDGTKSTPLLILEKAVQDPDMRQMLVTLSNDFDAENVRSLETDMNSLPGIKTLRFKPDVRNETVGEEIVKDFEQSKFVPTLFFVDPWGYKRLSLRLVNSVLMHGVTDRPALVQGRIDSDLVELIAFKAEYRHEHTDYDDLIRESGDREDARASMAPTSPIPDHWADYLDHYGFTGEVAEALARTLKDPRRCQPVWFKEAEIAVRRAGLDLSGLTYDQIRDGIEDWREMRTWD